MNGSRITLSNKDDLVVLTFSLSSITFMIFKNLVTILRYYLIKIDSPRASKAVGDSDGARFYSYTYRAQTESRTLRAMA